MTVIQQEFPIEQLAGQMAGHRPRFNMYQGIHKALRAFMADTLLRVGRTDHSDPLEREEAASQLRALLHFCGEHLAHENRFVHAAIEQRAPGGTAHCAREHVGHQAEIAKLQDGLAQAMQAAPAQQAGAWQDLYLALSLFVADNLEHMVMEERDHNALLWQHFSDAELIEVHDALVASVPPQEMAQTMRWMLPQLSHAERVGMLTGMRQGMPAEVFQAQLQMVQPLLPTRAWDKLQSALSSTGGL